MIVIAAIVVCTTIIIEQRSKKKYPINYTENRVSVDFFNDLKSQSPEKRKREVIFG